MPEESIVQQGEFIAEDNRDTKTLIAEMNEQIARIKQLRICIAFYLISISNDLENRNFPFRENSG